jgi:hypothetical protein
MGIGQIRRFAWDSGAQARTGHLFPLSGANESRLCFPIVGPALWSSKASGKKFDQGRTALEMIGYVCRLHTRMMTPPLRFD